jgi:NRPS condensation-like uncharacterized protein
MTADRQPRFRFSAVMREPVDPAVLQRALDDVLPRVPYFRVALREGFFWPRFEQHDAPVPAEDDGGTPFADAADPDALFRVTYHGRTISLEMHHVLADGYGATVFLKTLLARYLTLLGARIAPDPGVLDLEAPPDPAEYADPIASCCRGTTRREEREPLTYHACGTPSATTVETFVMDADSVVACARRYGVTVTEYLSGLFVHALAEEQRAERPVRELPVKVSVSANLRRFYPAITLRNFAYFANVGIEPHGRELVLGDTIAGVSASSREFFSERRLNERMSAQMRYYRLLKPLPFVLKRAIFELVYLLTGERTFSMVFTNMGVLELPLGMREHVERIDTLANGSGSVKLKCGAITCNGVLSVTFTNGLGHARIEQRFCELLAEEGIALSDAGELAHRRAATLDEAAPAKETA